MFDGNVAYADHQELTQLSGVFDLLPLLPPEAIRWLLAEGRYRRLRAKGLFRQLGVLALALRGEPATREHVRHIVAATWTATRDALARVLRERAGDVGGGAGDALPTAPSG
jgi:hypothetical protein